MTTTNGRKKVSPTLITLAAVATILVIFTWTSYNGLVSRDETINEAFGNLQSQYQRRTDLVPNLVNTVKGYAQHEASTLQAVVDARAKATQISVSPDNLTPEKLRQLQQAQGELSAALGKLLAISENYPDLKASQNFLTLQEQLEGTENRITVARDNYNKAVKEYNKKVRTFPNNIISGLFGFENREMFAAEAGADKAPAVSFE